MKEGKKILGAIITILVGLVIALVALFYAMINGIEIGGFYDREDFQYNLQKTNEEIKLNIDIEAGAVEIIQSDDFYIEVENSVVDTLEISSGENFIVINQTLPVLGGKLFNWSFDVGPFISIGESFSESIKVKIYIPKEQEISSIEVKNNVGEVVVSGFELESLEVNTDLSNIDIKNVEAEDVDLKSNVGEIEVEDCTFFDGEIKNDIGNVDFEGEIFGDFYMETNIGNVDLRLNSDKEDFNVEINTDLGSGRIDGDKEGSFDGENSKYKLDLFSNIGNIEVRFDEN